MVDPDLHTTVLFERSRSMSFPPASISDECYLEEKNCKIGAEVDHIKIELPEIHSNGELDKKLFHGEQKKNGDGDILGHDRLSTTPPNDDAFCKSVAETDRGNEVGVGLQSTDRTVENASSTSISGFDPTAKEPNNPSKNRLGLVPCSRSKLFRTPSSFSYRRLLSFLMDIRNDNLGALETRPFEDVEKVMTKKSHETFMSAKSNGRNDCKCSF